MTQIITTIGPVTLNLPTLEYFAKHNVAIARLNLSHGDPAWHLQAANLIKQTPLRILLDLCGPKIRLGVVNENVNTEKGQIVELEMQKLNQSYPYKGTNGNLVFPYHFALHEHLKTSNVILIDDGKMQWEVTEVRDNGLTCKVLAGGIIKSRKGLNTPGADLNVHFLTDYDKTMLEALLVQVKPKILACSFVKTANDIVELKTLVKEKLDEAGVTDYFPEICAKIEMAEAIENLESIVEEVDLIMIARGDLALEAVPVHTIVPFLQDYIVETCQRMNKPFVVATQVLESMMSCPVPTRAEVSDLYRAVKYNKADFVMLSGETAGGEYPIECVKVMDDMINMVKEEAENISMKATVQTAIPTAVVNQI